MAIGFSKAKIRSTKNKSYLKLVIASLETLLCPDTNKNTQDSILSNACLFAPNKEDIFKPYAL